MPSDSKSPVHDLALGTIQRGPLQFITQLSVDEPDAPFDLILPGQVTRCEGTTALLSVLPYGRLAIKGGKLPRFATVSAEILDNAALDRAMSPIAEALDFEDTLAFGIRFASDRHTYAEVVAAAERALEGCGCDDGLDRGASMIGSVSVCVEGSSEDQQIWSTPVRARIKAWTGDDGLYGPHRDGVHFASLVFDCYSEWWIRGWWAKKETTCHGPCTAPKICACGKDKRGRLQIACDGWIACWCQ